MTTLAYILLGLIGVVALVAVVWRGASRRRSLPCPTWLSRLVELDNPFTETNRAAVIVERLELQPGMAVLDVGCGPGRVAIPIASKVGPDGEVVAVDIQPGMLRRAQEKARAAKVTNIRFLEAGQAPRVVLRATHEGALSHCSLADLKRFAVDLA